MTDPQTIVVTVDRTSTATVTRQTPLVTTTVESSTVATIASPPPAVTDVEVVDGVVDLVEYPRGPQGLTGPQGEQGLPGDDGAVMSVNTKVGDVVLDADDVGADPAGAALAAAAASMATHVADPDPHTQYRQKAAAIDGGFF